MQGRRSSVGQEIGSGRGREWPVEDAGSGPDVRRCNGEMIDGDLIQPAGAVAIGGGDVGQVHCPAEGMYAGSQFMGITGPIHCAGDERTLFPIVEEGQWVECGPRRDFPGKRNLARAGDGGFQPGCLLVGDWTAARRIDPVGCVGGLVVPNRISARGPDLVAIVDGIAQGTGYCKSDGPPVDKSGSLVGEHDGSGISIAEQGIGIGVDGNGHLDGLPGRDGPGRRRNRQPIRGGDGREGAGDGALVGDDVGFRAGREGSAQESGGGESFLGRHGQVVADGEDHVSDLHEAGGLVAEGDGPFIGSRSKRVGCGIE